MADTSAPEATEAAAIRAGIRNWMDRLEAAAYASKPLTLTPLECAELDLLFRRVQDAAAKALGYE